MSFGEFEYDPIDAWRTEGWTDEIHYYPEEFDSLSDFIWELFDDMLSDLDLDIDY